LLTRVLLTCGCGRFGAKHEDKLKAHPEEVQASAHYGAARVSTTDFGNLRSYLHTNTLLEQDRKSVSVYIVMAMSNKSS